MQYPIWNVPLLGGGMVIAIIAIVHVSIAHYAVGAGLFTVLTEQKAYRRNLPVLLRFLKDYSFFLIYISFVLGALTGVGIWFSIALVSPEATSALIHQFVWGWATEWVFFIVEIVSGYIYYYTWDRLSPKQHLIVGWIYAVAAWMSLVIINGILSFMLSPGKWTQTHNFWDGFFNPTYWPSLVLRTISSLSLAAIFVAIAANLAKGYTREERHEIIIEGGRWLIPLALMLPAAIWYFTGVPEAARRHIQGRSIAMVLFFAFGITSSTLVGLYAYVGLIYHRRFVNLETSLLLGAIAFVATGSMEFVREGIRKPYIIYDYMYSNAVLVKDTERLNKEGVLNWAPWAVFAAGGDPAALKPLQRGEANYRAQCSRCHTLDGVNDIQPLIQDWPESSIRHAIDTLHVERYYMPPFLGPDKDKEDLTQYLLNLIQPKATSVSQTQPTSKSNRSGKEKSS